MKLRTLLIHWLLASLALTLAYQATPAYNLDAHGIVLTGFHGAERDKERPYRWSEARAVISLIGIGRRPYRATLTLSGSRPPGMELPNVRLLANAQPIAAFKPVRSTRDYTFDIPAEAMDVWGHLNLRIESDTFVPQNDLRTLGVILYAVHLEPTESSFVTPAGLTLLWAMLSLALFYRAGTNLRLPSVILHGFCALVWLAVSLGLATERLLTVELLPYCVLLGALSDALSQRLSPHRTEDAGI